MESSGSMLVSLRSLPRTGIRDGPTVLSLNRGDVAMGFWIDMWVSFWLPLAGAAHSSPRGGALADGFV